MVKVNYIICAGRILQDRGTGKYTYVDIFDLIRMPNNLQFIYQSFSIGGKIDGIKEGTHKIELKVFAPDNLEFTSYSFGETQLKEGIAPFSIGFPLLKFEKKGIYKIKIFYDDEELKDNDKFYFKIAGEDE